jgi:TonB family protein
MNLHGWQSAFDGRCVLFNEDVVRDLRMLAIEGFTALPRRGLEVGGILLGDTSSGELRIGGYRESLCEHRFGPSYALSDTDREKLTELLAQPRKEPVVGFFRSVTGREPAIEQADEALVSDHFPNGDCVFLLLHPRSAENCVATVRFFQQGRLAPLQEEPVFPFEPKKMPLMQLVLRDATESARELAPVVAICAPVMVAEPEQPPEPVPEPVAKVVRFPRMWPSEPAPPRQSHWWRPVLICFLGALGGAGIYELGRSQTLTQAVATPRFADLRLDAMPRGGKVLVTWDGAAVRAVDANQGALTITDGDTPREVELNGSQVRGGKYAYAPAHPDLSVRLTLLANGHSVASESVRLAPAAASDASSTPAPPSAAAPTPVPAPTPAASNLAAPPTAVHEVHPAIPAGIRSRIEGPIVIPVEVKVNEQGRVFSAQVHDKSDDGIHRYLAEQAGRAAREWQFHPARGRDGQPIVSSKTIEFVFTP